MLRCPWCALPCLPLWCLAARASPPVPSAIATVAIATLAQVILRSLGGLRKPICIDSPLWFGRLPGREYASELRERATYSRECERSHAWCEGWLARRAAAGHRRPAKPA